MHWSGVLSWATQPGSQGPKPTANTPQLLGWVGGWVCVCVCVPGDMGRGPGGSLSSAALPKPLSDAPGHPGPGQSAALCGPCLSLVAELGVIQSRVWAGGREHVFGALCPAQHGHLSLSVDQDVPENMRCDNFLQPWEGLQNSAPGSVSQGAGWPDPASLPPLPCG